ncbi:hypothetical protein BaRGS_00039424, partial [Batillaria attramentaria]
KGSAREVTDETAREWHVLPLRETRGVTPLNLELRRFARQGESNAAWFETKPRKASYTSADAYGGYRQTAVSWRRIGEEHFITIGTLVWKQDNNIVMEHSEWADFVSDWNLVFKEARPEDAGTYECQVIHTNTIKWRVRLNVILISLMGKEFVESGESIYLLCNTTEGNRIPDDVDWFKDGTKINKREFPHIIITKYRELENTALVSELIIDRGKRKDSGTYICRNSIDQLASLEVTVLVAESTNIKRGSGSSHTTMAPMRGENRAVTFTFILGNPFTVTLLVAFTSLLTFNYVTT